MKKTINTMEELLKTLGLEDENHINWFDVSRNRKLSEICEGNGFFIYYFIFFEKEKKYEKNNKYNGRTFKNFRFRR